MTKNNTKIYISHQRDRLTINFPSIADNINQAEKETLKFLGNSGFAKDDVFSICLVMREGLVNAVQHGNHHDPEKIVKYSLLYEDDILTMTIEDQGEGFDWNSLQNVEPAADVDHGRGIFIMRFYFSEYKYNKRGNKLTLSRYSPRDEQKQGDRASFLEKLAQSLLKSPEKLKDVADEDVFRLLESLYIQRHQLELLNAKLRRRTGCSSCEDETGS